MAKEKAPAFAPGWWGQRWLQYLHQTYQVQPSDAQVRGARQGEARITAARGSVRASVAVGRYGDTAEAVLRVKPLTKPQWRRVVAVLAENPDAARRVLSGNLGPELEQCFASAGSELFPEPAVRSPLRCSCGARWGCRHVKVLAVRGAELFDGNPFLWLEVLGLPRAEVRARLADTGQVLPEVQVALAGGAGTTQPLAPDRFWQGAADPDAIAVHPGGAAPPDALLRALGPLSLPGEVGAVEMLAGKGKGRGAVAYASHPGKLQPLGDVLGRYIVHMGLTARELAAGTAAPIHHAEKLPGQAIPTGVRLAAEVEMAVRQAGGPLNLDELHRLCPTAAAVPSPYHYRWLMDAFPDLSPDLVVLAQSCVAPRGAVLEGSVFRHVVTHDEWRRQRLSPAGEWARVIEVAGFAPPYTVRVAGGGSGDPSSLFAVLRPEVGDELSLTVADPETPVLEARLRRRAERSGAESHAANAAMVQTLLAYMEDRDLRSLSQQEAVEVLLAAGRYREGTNWGPVWLLPLFGRGLYYDANLFRGDDWLDFSRRHQYPLWAPTFGRPYAYWKEQDTVIRHYTVMLTNRGAIQKEVEQAVRCVQGWCRHWRGSQDRKNSIPTLAAFLDFLWNAAPLEARSARPKPEAVLANLADWFRLLYQQFPALSGAYDDHIAACGLTAAFAHRQQTALASRMYADDALQAWRAEGYRWIGPEAYFARD